PQLRFFHCFFFSPFREPRNTDFAVCAPSGVFTSLRPLRSSSGKNSRWRTGHRPLFRFTVPKPPSRGTQTLHLCAPIRQKSANRSYICSESSLLRTEPNCSAKTNLGRRNDMRMPFCLLALLGLAGCVAETPVTTTTTEVTRTVTTGPVATQPVTREVLVTQAPPPVRVETRTVA